MKQKSINIDVINCTQTKLGGLLEIKQKNIRFDCVINMDWRIIDLDFRLSIIIKNLIDFLRKILDFGNFIKIGDSN